MSNVPQINLEPTAFVETLLQPHVVGGKLSFRQRDIQADKLIDDLALSADAASGTLQFTDEQAEKLLIAALSNKRVADFARTCIAANLEGYGPLPPALRLLASLLITGAAGKGRQGRKKGDNYERDMWIYTTVSAVSQRFALPIARNDAPSPSGNTCIKSASEYVSDGLQPYGGPGFDRVADIYYEVKDFLASSDALDPKKEIARALLRPRREKK